MLDTATDQQKVTKQEFLQRWRAKYPAYNNKPDDALYDAIIKKYPVYADRIKPDAPVDSRSNFQKLRDWIDEPMKPAPDESGITGAIDNFGRGVARGSVGVLNHPIDAIKSIIPSAGLSTMAGGSSGSGYPITPPMIGSATARSAGQMNQQARENAQKVAAEQGTNPAYLVGNLTGTTLLTGGAAKSLKAGGESFLNSRGDGPIATAAKSVGRKIGLEVSPVGRGEMLRRKLSQSFGVDVPATEQVVKSLQGQLGDILDYSRKTGQSINNPLEFVKVAEQRQAMVDQAIRERFIGPIANDQVSTSGSNYRGPTVGEGGRAKLIDVYNRIGQINKELSPNYAKKTQMGVNAANVSDAELQAERASLVGILEKTVSQKRGIPQQVFHDLRVRSGQLFDLAENIKAATNVRARAVAMENEGATPLGEGKTGLINKGIRAVRGGREGIAARGMRKQLGKVKPIGKPIPEPDTNE